MKRLGHLPVDFSDLKRKGRNGKRAKTETGTADGTDSDSDESDEDDHYDPKPIKVDIGQAVKDGMVKFVARVGNKTVGLASFNYEAIAPEDGGEDVEKEEEGNPNTWL